MKKHYLIGLSLAALLFGRPAGLCSANAADDRELEDHTIEELKEIASHYKVTITSEMKKADIVAAIKGAAGYKPGSRAGDKELTLEERLAALETENREMKKQLAMPPVLDPAPPDGPLAMLCKGAGVDITDVRWRIRAGLDAEQAVEAAIFQRDNDAKRKAADEAEEKKTKK